MKFGLAILSLLRFGKFQTLARPNSHDDPPSVMVVSK